MKTLLITSSILPIALCVAALTYNYQTKKQMMEAYFDVQYQRIEMEYQKSMRSIGPITIDCRQDFEIHFSEKR